MATKAQLAQQLEAAHQAYERLAAKHEALGLDYDQAQEALRRVDKERSAAKSAPGQARSSFQQRCLAAKQQAVQTGRCVRV